MFAELRRVLPLPGRLQGDLEFRQPQGQRTPDAIGVDTVETVRAGLAGRTGEVDPDHQLAPGILRRDPIGNGLPGRADRLTPLPIAGEILRGKAFVLAPSAVIIPGRHSQQVTLPRQTGARSVWSKPAA